jgi:hypothetical protein
MIKEIQSNKIDLIQWLTIFNLQYAAQINSIKFDWNWRAEGLTEIAARFWERALTCKYIMENNGRLPWKHKLPSFINDPRDAEDDLDDLSIEDLLEVTQSERKRRAKQWLDEQNINCN